MTRFALIVGILLLMLIGGSTPARAQRSADVDNSEALLRVMVSDGKGRKISGLQQDNFTVHIDGAPAKIVRFRDLKEPASIGIVLDVSGSTDTRWSDASRSLVRFGKGLDHFQRLSNKANEFFVIGFNDQPALLLDWTSEQKPISDIFPSIRAQGQTALFDACYIAVDKVNRARHRKRVIVIFSDGQDNRSRYTFRELRDFIWQSDVLIYSINPIFLTESSLAKEAQSILDELSVNTGGMTFSTIRNSGFSSENFMEIFERISDDLENLYEIGVRLPDSLKESDWHQVRVRTISPLGANHSKNWKIRTRKEYYHPKSQSGKSS